jgi:hypothetical protein
MLGLISNREVKQQHGQNGDSSQKVFHVAFAPNS